MTPAKSLLPIDRELLVIMTNAFRESLYWQQQTSDVVEEPVDAVAKAMRLVLNALRPYISTTPTPSEAEMVEAIKRALFPYMTDKFSEQCSRVIYATIKPWIKGV